MLDYIGHKNQVASAEVFTLNGAKGEGMKFVSLRSGNRVEALISLDRCADIARLSFKGDNYGYMSPCGFVSSPYYDKDGCGFLKSFTAGFLTTCGFNNIGGPCNFNGEQLPQHGTIANTPAELLEIKNTDEFVQVKAEINDAVLFGRKLKLVRTITLYKNEPTLKIDDEITNFGSTKEPFCLLYHCNMGYPLLDEDSQIVIPGKIVGSPAEYPAFEYEQALKMEKPDADYVERCFFYDVDSNNDKSRVGIFSKNIGSGVVIEYDKTVLEGFCEWKMMGKHDYVLGLEPGNNPPLMVSGMAEKGVLKFIEPEQTIKTGITLRFTESNEEFNKMW